MDGNSKNLMCPRCNITSLPNIDGGGDPLQNHVCLKHRNQGSITPKKKRYHPRSNIHKRDLRLHLNQQAFRVSQSFPKFETTSRFLLTDFPIPEETQIRNHLLPIMDIPSTSMSSAFHVRPPSVALTESQEETDEPSFCPYCGQHFGQIRHFRAVTIRIHCLEAHSYEMFRREYPLPGIDGTSRPVISIPPLDVRRGVQQPIPVQAMANLSFQPGSTPMTTPITTNPFNLYHPPPNISCPPPSLITPPFITPTLFGVNLPPTIPSCACSDPTAIASACCQYHPPW
jgi:hypothetical protein